MDNKKNFFASAALLAVSNMLLRCVAISFNAYVSAKVGSESMGLFSLVMSVYGFAVTLACSGVNLAAVRLTAEKTARLEEHGADGASYKSAVRAAVRSCALYSTLFGVGTAVLLYALSAPIGEYLLGDERCVPSLRVLAVSLPAISLSSALSGCFTSLRKVYKNAIVSVSEQFIKICIICTCLSALLPRAEEPVGFACLATVGGGALAEGASLILNALLYLADSKRPVGARSSDRHGETESVPLREAAGLALPVAVGSYARQGLSTAEHLLLPRGLQKSGLTQSAALSAVGELQGMAFPLILFPSSLLSSAAGLLIPELARLCELERYREREKTVTCLMSASLAFSVGCASLFCFFGRNIGIAVYGSEKVGRMLCAVAPLIPIMYTDMAVDCVLKGIGLQRECMRVNIVDAASSLALVAVLVPLFGLRGYIASVYFCEILNFLLSLRLLRRVTHISAVRVRNVGVPLFWTLISLAAARVLCRQHESQGLYGAAMFASLYTVLAVIHGIVGARRQKNTANIQK